uniref:G-protein coupled receptors family 1 profile domain-containing protein n=1 Tax=Noctiluca scintillans TaxID=2966 RepID=A0A7S1AX95_NOCSC
MQVDFFFFHLILWANVSSLVAGLWLMLYLRASGKHLLPRLLWHLSLADSLVAVTVCANLLTGLQGNVECKFVLSFIVGGLWVSILVQTYIAAAYMCIYCRFLKTLHFLNGTLCVAWPVGLTIAAFFVFSERCAERDNMLCKFVVTGNRSQVYERVEVVMRFVCFVASLAFYTTALFRVRHFPASVRRFVQRTAISYPIIFFVTYGPIALYLTFELRSNATEVFYVGMCLEGLNGLLNTLAYFVNSRYAVHFWSKFLRRLQEGDAAVIPVPSGMQNIVSFHVGFALASESEVTMFSSNQSFHSATADQDNIFKQECMMSDGSESPEMCIDSFPDPSSFVVRR